MLSACKITTIIWKKNKRNVKSGKNTREFFSVFSCFWKEITINYPKIMKRKSGRGSSVRFFRPHKGSDPMCDIGKFGFVLV